MYFVLFLTKLGDMHLKLLVRGTCRGLQLCFGLQKNKNKKSRINRTSLVKS